eukprot:TRINITY_DN553_c0_g1_i1.p1 TRINITY_DN553_c0_g1~~TRINITY_DN553_c0_g1_i1.p1  ORF type:complete len:900 (+),score=261.94 TRINITY_DN553_c0_g1_i1:206-2905(+)
MALLKETLVVKVNVEGVSDELHRFTFGKGVTLCFTDLEKKICARFGLPVASSLRMTYKDEEDEKVVMTDDDDLKDAINLQSLNPLRLYVVVKKDAVKNDDSVPRAVPVTIPTNEEKKSDDVPVTAQTDERESPEGSVHPDLVSAVERLMSAVKKTENGATENVNRVIQQLDGGLGKSNEKSLDDVSRLRNIPGVAGELLKALASKGGTSQVTPAAAYLEVMKALRATKGSSSQVPSSQSAASADVKTAVPATTSNEGKAPEATTAIKKAVSETGETSQQVEVTTPSEVENQSQVNKGMVSGVTHAHDEEDGVTRVFHTRVQCDGCGMLPIVGPRFKSLVKHDYDLCETCHNSAEDKENYSRIDRPLYKPRHQPFWGPQRSRGGGNRLPGNPPPGTFGGRPFHFGPVHPCSGHRGPFGPPPPPFFPCNQQQCFSGDRSQEGLGLAVGKLDSRFVRDVSIFDGTELAPGTAFTKIWCLRNSGTIPWPQGTSLLHIGGDKLGEVSSVALPLPPSGLAVGEECEVAVDAVAPVHPGRYISHWRLVAPGGPKFGHRVWVLILVVPKGELSPEESALLSDAIASVGTEAVEKQSSDSVSVSSEQPAVTAGGSKVEVAAVHPPEESPFGVPSGALSAKEGEVANDVASLEEACVDDYFVSEANEEVLNGTPDDESNVLTPDVETSDDAAAVVNDDQTSAIETAEVELIDLSAAEVTEPTTGSVAQPETIEETARVLHSPTKTEHSSAPDSPTKTENTSVGGFALLPYPTVESSPVITEMFAEAAAAAGDDNDMMEVETVETSEEDFEVGQVEASADPELQQLKAMGFTDGNLNLYLLARNSWDLLKTVDDLVLAAEWDPLLEELEEMGFMDVEMNRRLMFKNDGSVKRVVKELVEIALNKSAGVKQ